MHVLGTAGHVDHGKSSLVLALTGIDPDRLPEEKERGLTIDLGFAWFETEAGPLGVVDVPGHERFVRTMIAGVGGIDLVMLVVAADDGWMPQTQEHLDILRLLDIQTGVIAVTKCDLVDNDWLQLVHDDVRAKTKGTFLEGVRIVSTAATSGVGIEELRNAIAAAQNEVVRRADIGRGRLPVDRVFTIAGQGTVVTGTLRDGPLATDSQVYLFPGDRTVRLRSIQTHKEGMATAQAGSRVAANLAATEKDDVRRGDWLFVEKPVALPRYMGVELEILPDVPFALKQGMPVLIVFGTSEIAAKLVLRDGKALGAGMKTVAQMDLEAPLCARFGDRFVLRLPSPQITIGGGRFLDPTGIRYTTKRTVEWEALQQLIGGDVAEWIEGTIRRDHQVSRESLYRFAPGSRKEFDALLDEGTAASRWLCVQNTVIDPVWWEEVQKKIAEIVQEFHRAHPAETGPQSAEVLSNACDASALHEALIGDLQKHGVRTEGPYLCHNSHRAGLSNAQQAIADKWRAQFAEAPYATPVRSELLDQTPEARTILDFLLKSGEWTELKDGILLRTEDYERAIRMTVNAIRADGPITVAQFRDLIGTTRKYALPLLDRFDRLGYTRREGDERVAGPRAAEVETDDATA